MLRQHRVRVGRQIQRKLLKVEDGLTGLGVHIHFEQTTPKPKAIGHLDQVLNTARDIWLVYSIGKEAIGKFPTIREVLASAGLTRAEIITLGLSETTKTPKKNSSKTTKAPKKKKTPSKS